MASTVFEWDDPDRGTCRIGVTVTRAPVLYECVTVLTSPNLPDVGDLGRSDLLGLDDPAAAALTHVLHAERGVRRAHEVDPGRDVHIGDALQARDVAALQRRFPGIEAESLHELVGRWHDALDREWRRTWAEATTRARTLLEASPPVDHAAPDAPWSPFLVRAGSVVRDVDPDAWHRGGLARTLRVLEDLVASKGEVGDRPAPATVRSRAGTSVVERLLDLEVVRLQERLDTAARVVSARTVSNGAFATFLADRGATDVVVRGTPEAALSLVDRDGVERHLTLGTTLGTGGTTPSSAVEVFGMHLADALARGARVDTDAVRAVLGGRDGAETFKEAFVWAPEEPAPAPAPGP